MMSSPRSDSPRPAASPAVRRAVVLLGALGAAACGSSDEPTGPAVDGVRRSVAVASAVALDAKGSQLSEFVQPGVRVVRSAADWEAAWRQLTAGVTPAPTRPGVDFASQTVVIVALGTQPSGGYAVRADSAWTEGGALSLAVTQTSPGPRCMTAAVVTAPVSVAVLGAVASQVQVVRREVTLDCP